jgi:hypothetical protein
VAHLTVISRDPLTPFRSAQDDDKLFGPGQRDIESRLAAIRRISVDNPALGSFIDSRD